MRDRLIGHNPCEGVRLTRRRRTDTDDRVIGRHELVTQLLPAVPSTVPGARRVGRRDGPAVGRVRRPALGCRRPGRGHRARRPGRGRGVRTRDGQAVPEVASWPAGRAAAGVRRRAARRASAALRGRLGTGVHIADRPGSPARDVPRSHLAAVAGPGRPARQGRRGRPGQVLGPLAGPRTATSGRAEFTTRPAAIAHIVKHAHGGLRFHDLRHSYATWLVSDGVPINDVSAVMGHEQTSTTLDRYTHPSQDRDRRVRSVFADFLLTPAPDDDPETDE